MSYNRQRLFLLFAFFILFFPLFGQSQTNIAVLNFTARDVTETEAQVVSIGFE